MAVAPTILMTLKVYKCRLGCELATCWKAKEVLVVTHNTFSVPVEEHCVADLTRLLVVQNVELGYYLSKKLELCFPSKI